MRSRKLARRYAQAIGELAFEKESVDEIGKDLELVRTILSEQPALSLLLADPNTPKDEKDKVIVSLFDGRVNQVSLNFLRLVVEKQRGSELSQMIDEFFAYTNERRGIIEVEVTAAATLKSSEEEIIIKRLSEVTGREVRLLVKEDVTLLGGVIARVGDLVMDGSVKTRLESLRESLKKAQLN